MKILILNWRDVKHPASGGAEILTHELARRWVQAGHSVVQFSSFFKGAKNEEKINGVQIMRKGHPDARYLFWSVHFLAFWYYSKSFKGKFDVVIDEIHGLPFFTPLYVRERKIALICEVANELWYRMYGSVFGTIGRIIEIIYLRIIYRNIHFLTISNSTKKELVANGTKRDYIHVIPMGIRFSTLKKLPQKESVPTMIFVGRLSRPKGIEDAIEVLRLVKKDIASAKLWIVGRGEEGYTKFLKEQVERLQLEDSITFFGFVSEEEKFQLMAKAHLLIAPSMKEGFGLTIPEAGFVGTPAVGYNVLGLEDVLIDGESGALIEPNPSSMSKGVITILQNRELYQKMQKKAAEIAKTLSFDKSASTSLRLLKDKGVR